MKAIFLAMATATTIGALAQAQTAPTGPTGTWRSMGFPPVTLVLKADGPSVTGTIGAGAGATGTEISEGRLDGDVISFKVQIPAGRTVLFSSHQLDLVEDICESVAVIDRGRLVMEGRVSDLKARSGRRELRIDVEGDEARRRLEAVEGVRVTAADASGLRLALPPGADPLELLDRARAAGAVRDFGLEQPSLAELFLDAVDGNGRR